MNEHKREHWALDDEVPEDSVLSSGAKVLRHRTWWDAEPDACSVSLLLDASNGEPHIVVSGNATFLNADQAGQMAKFVYDCLQHPIWAKWAWEHQNDDKDEYDD